MRCFFPSCLVPEQSSTGSGRWAIYKPSRRQLCEIPYCVEKREPSAQLPWAGRVWRGAGQYHMGNGPIYLLATALFRMTRPPSIVAMAMMWAY